jgi:hypothetical protein
MNSKEVVEYIHQELLGHSKVPVLKTKQIRDILFPLWEYYTTDEEGVVGNDEFGLDMFWGFVLCVMEPCPGFAVPALVSNASWRFRKKVLQ